MTRQANYVSYWHGVINLHRTALRRTPEWCRGHKRRRSRQRKKLLHQHDGRWERWEEVKDAITQLNWTHQDGPREAIPICLHRLIVRIWETEQLPEKWKQRVLCPIYKKGDKLKCENYRTITILNVAYKLLPQVNFRRLTGSSITSHNLFIDFKAAYDSIDRTELWIIKDENRFPGKLTRLSKATMDGEDFRRTF